VTGLIGSSLFGAGDQAVGYKMFIATYFFLFKMEVLRL
jgi:hypothetical protein